MKGMGIMAFLAARGFLPERGYRTKPARVMERKPNILKNPKIGKQIQEMYEKWEREQFPSRVNKPEADPESISSIKKKHRIPRHLARMIKEGKASAPKSA